MKLSTRQSVLAYKQVLKGLGPLKSLNYLRLKTNQVNQMVPDIFDLNKRSSSDEGKENLMLLMNIVLITFLIKIFFYMEIF